MVLFSVHGIHDGGQGEAERAAVRAGRLRLPAPPRLHDTSGRADHVRHRGGYIWITLTVKTHRRKV